MDDEDDDYFDDDDSYYDGGICYCPECCAFRSGYKAGYSDALYDLGEGYE